MNEVDKLVRKRAHNLQYAALAFSLWQLAWLAKDMMPVENGVIYTLVSVLYLIGSLGWVLWSVLFALLGKRIKRTAAGMALNDELTRHNRLLAFQAGYLVLFSSVFILTLAIASWGIDGQYGIRLIAIIGLVTPMLAFAHLELKNDSGAE